MRTLAIAFGGFALALATAASGGRPLAECYEHAESRRAVAPCLEQKLAEAEQALQRAYAAGTRSIAELSDVTGRAEVSEAYPVAEEEFLRFRAANCRWYRLRAEPGTGAGDIELDCLVQMTLDRVSELEREFPKKDR
jgi:uncharacterized protein YecT (DUF1311 family)